MVGHYQFGKGVGEHIPHVIAAIEALNHSIEGTAGRSDPPAPLLGQLRRSRITTTCRCAELIEYAFRANVETISFEGANPAHEYEWELFKDVKLPDDKVLMPGMIDVCNPRIEHPRLIAQRLLRYAEIVGREQVIAGTDCGFSTFAGWHNVPPSVCWGKLRALADGAELASRELW